MLERENVLRGRENLKELSGSGAAFKSRRRCLLLASQSQLLPASRAGEPAT